MKSCRPDAYNRNTAALPAYCGEGVLIEIDVMEEVEVVARELDEALPTVRLLQGVAS